MQTRGRMTIPSFTAGGRKLPGGRASVVLAFALLAACGAPAATSGPAETPRAIASTTETPSAVPTLGTKPPPGLVFQTYFVTVTSSSNGSIAVLTAPASACGLSVRAPAGGTVEGGQIVADAKGVAGWTYTPLTGHGESVLTVTCKLGDQTQSAKAQVLLP